MYLIPNQTSVNPIRSEYFRRVLCGCGEDVIVSQNCEKGSKKSTK